MSLHFKKDALFAHFEGYHLIGGSVCHSGHTDVRLVGGSDHCAGRVEIWQNGTWGTVCDDGWDEQDARVVCAQLGCGVAVDATGERASFGPGKGRITMVEVNCSGKETQLQQCPFETHEHFCGHKEDAGVVCSGNPHLG